MWVTRILVVGLCITALGGCNDNNDKNVATGEKTQAPASLTVEQAGRYQVTPYAFDDSAAEIVAFDARLGRLFVVNSSARTVDVFDVSDPDNLSRMGQIDATEEGASANSVAVNGRTVAVAIEADDKTDPGKVAFYNASDFSRLGEASVGALPDMVTFTPDGQRVLVANEGEPNDEYTTDPQGSISVIDVSSGFQQPPVATADFTAYNKQADDLRATGVRIFGPNASVAQDLEPEYIAVASDSSTAYVRLCHHSVVVNP